MSQPRIYMSEANGFHPAALRRLRTCAEVELADADRASLLQGVGSADVLWIRLRHRIDAEVFAAAPHLKMIITPTTGLNHIDLEAAHKRGIRVLSLRGEAHFLKDVRATAELTIALMLALLRHLPAANEHVREGGWNRDLFLGGELCGKIVGLVGFGRLGRLVARYLQSFDARVLACDPFLPRHEFPPYVEPLSMAELLPAAEMVSLHVSLGPETQGMFGKPEFAAMQRGAWLINTARGELVDESALLAALKSGQLAGAALDVLCHENSLGMQDHPVVAYAREHANVILTPHVGGCTAESMAKTETFMVEKFLQAWPQWEASQVVHDNI